MTPSEIADRPCPTRRPRGSIALGCIIVAAAALIVGWPTLDGAFLSGDDHRLILDHYLVTHPSAENAIELLTIVHGDLYQPLPMLSFQANYAMSGRQANGEPSPRAFHWTNVALHAANAMLVFLLACRLAACRRIGLLTGLFFAVHPFAIETVAWIGGRMVLLMNFFALSCWLIRINIRAARRSAVAETVRERRGAPTLWNSLNDSAIAIAHGVLPLIFWLFSLASKVLPTGPIVGALIEAHCRPERRRSILRFHGLCLVLAVAASAYALHTTRAYGVLEDTSAGGSFILGIATALRYFVENYVWPMRLSPWIPDPVDHSTLTILIAAVEGIVICSLALFAWRRDLRAAIGIVIFTVLIAPFLITSAARSTVAADRYMYLPIMGLHLAFACAIIRSWDAFYASRRRIAWGVLPLLTGVLIGFWHFQSAAMAEVWRDTLSRDRRSFKINPDDVRSHAQLAGSYTFAGRPDEALRVIHEARLRWGPEDPGLAIRAGEAYRKLGRHAEALVEFREALSDQPNDLRTRYLLALAWIDSKDADEAIAEFRRILRRRPGYLPAVTALANLLRQQNEIEGARRLFDKALTINRHDRTALQGLAAIAMQQADWESALRLNRRIVDDDGENWATQLNLGVCLTRLNRFDEAMAVYDRLLERGQSGESLRANRAAVLLAMGRERGAEIEYRALLSIDKRGYTPMVGLTELMMKGGRRTELPKLWEDFVAKNPDVEWARAWYALSLSLAGRGPKASKIAQTVTSNSDYKPLANWALAVDALQRKDGKGVLRALGPPRRTLPAHPERFDEGKVIQTFLLDLPKDLGETAAARYMLARSSFHDGTDGFIHLALALYYPDENPLLWESADKALLDQLPHPVTTSRGATAE
jgi:tetratricopeptide (TPR) repeat protein